MDLLKIQDRLVKEALGVRLSQPWRRVAIQFDDENLVSCAGLVPVMQLAGDTGLHEFVADAVQIDDPPIPSTGVNPAGKISSIVAGMTAGADSIDDLDVLRHGGMPELFGEVYAPSTLGSFLRAFTWGHTRQLASAARYWPEPTRWPMWTSTRCCGGCTGIRRKARGSGTRRSAGTTCCCGGCPRWSPRCPRRWLRRWWPRPGCATAPLVR